MNSETVFFFLLCFVVGFIVGVGWFAWQCESGRMSKRNLEHFERRRQWREAMPKQNAQRSRDGEAGQVP